MDDPVCFAERLILLDLAGWCSEKPIRALQRIVIETIAAVLTGHRPVSVVDTRVYKRLSTASEALTLTVTTSLRGGS